MEADSQIDNGKMWQRLEKQLLTMQSALIHFQPLGLGRCAHSSVLPSIPWCPRSDVWQHGQSVCVVGVRWLQDVSRDGPQHWSVSPPRQDKVAARHCWLRELEWVIWLIATSLMPRCLTETVNLAHAVQLYSTTALQLLQLQLDCTSVPKA